MSNDTPKQEVTAWPDHVLREIDALEEKYDIELVSAHFAEGLQKYRRHLEDKLTAAQAENAELRATIKENIATIKTLSEQVGAASELRAKCERLKGALTKIEKWNGEFPDTGRYWDGPVGREPMSYAAAFGSNGERDYMRQIARDALAHAASEKGAT